MGTATHTLLFELSSFLRHASSASVQVQASNQAGSSATIVNNKLNNDDSDINGHIDKEMEKDEKNEAADSLYNNNVQLVGAIPSPRYKAYVTALAWVPEMVSCIVDHDDASVRGVCGVNWGVNSTRAQTPGMLLAVRPPYCVAIFMNSNNVVSESLLRLSPVVHAYIHAFRRVVQSLRTTAVREIY